MTALTTLLVDDESLARNLLRAQLKDIDEVDVVGEAVNGRNALAKIAELNPDLLFLDIHMPGLDGFDVIRGIQADVMPLVVFVTAYDKHALEAFDVNAVDYILKPAEPERIRRAVARALLRRGEAGAMTKEAILRATQQLSPGSYAENGQQDAETEERLVVKSSSETLFIEPTDIQWIDAAGDYMCIHVGQDTHISRVTMRELEERLNPDRFVRIHRSTIVNTREIERVVPLKKGESMLHLRSGSSLKVSRSYRHAIRNLVAAS